MMSVMNGFRTELINKIVGFNSHITVQSFGDPIYKNKINSNLKQISSNIIFSNSGEAVILNNNSTKGIILRGYSENDFSSLEITKNRKFKSENPELINDLISVSYTHLTLPTKA